MTVKRDTKVDAAMELKFSQQLNDKMDLKAILSKPGVSSIKCDEGKSTLTISFDSLNAVKEFHNQFRYEDIKIFIDRLFEEPKVTKVFGNAGYSVYVDVSFSIPEVECHGLPEPGKL